MSIVHSEELDKLQRRIASLENRLGNINYEMKGVVRTELTSNSTIAEQSEMQFGMYTALCVDTVDIWKQNRIRFFCPVYHDPKRPIKELPWAFPVSSMGGFDDSGLSWVPPAGSTVCLLFECGNRASPFYIGTTWHRNRGPAGAHNWGYNIDEYYKIWEGHRGGYLVGPDDESQVLPPWNTESYNGFDLNSIVDFANNPEAQKRITYPHIYGFKTPEKHMIKMVDGDPRCSRRWKRFEIMSSCGQWMMFKDDHLHYGGQWAHPTCGVPDDDVSCIEEQGEGDSSEDITRFEGLGGSDAATDELLDATDNNIAQLLQGKIKEKNFCEDEKSNTKIIGGHPSTGHPNTKYVENQAGANPYFKHQSECRPYKGPGTPENNKIDLPQSGIQFMSMSGHTFVMDDSVEEPQGESKWERSMESFDFGCNDKFVGRTYWKSTTGHMIEISDVEEKEEADDPPLRGEDNYIRLLTAQGNRIELNDHTITGDDDKQVAGEKRGITLESTSTHRIEMIDYLNEQPTLQRMGGMSPVPLATQAFVRIRTGYGLEMMFADYYDQRETQEQYIQIFCPQKDNEDRGPHIHRYQEAPSGPGLVMLRVGGNYFVSTYDDHMTIVGDEEENPADLIEIVSRINLVYTKDVYLNITDEMHYFLAKDKILLMAGEDCSDDPENGCACPGPQPCLAPVLVFDLCKGCVRISDRVYASTSQDAPPVNLFMLDPFRKCENCSGGGGSGGSGGGSS